MPSVWQSKNQKTGEPHKLWKFYYIDFRGKRKFGTGTKNYEDTLKLATLLEDEHREMRVGLKPTPAENKVSSKFSVVFDEYVEWLQAQGGHHNFPVSKEHLRKKVAQLKFWEQELSLRTLGDLVGALPKVEKILREMLKAGKSGRTCNNYAESLTSFTTWACKRQYLSENPFQYLERMSQLPESIRRALTLDEIPKLFAVCTPERRFLYLIALITGLRASELASIFAEHIDLKNSGIILEPRWTKNRKGGFIGLPEAIMQQFQDSINILGNNTPLLNVPKDTSRAIRSDLNKAGIPIETDEGKVTFHSLRNTYITLCIENGANPKEAQTLARHSTVDLTLGLYARTRQNRLNEITQNVVNAIDGN